MPKKKKAKKTKKIKVIKKIKIKNKSKINLKLTDKKNATPGADEKPEIKKIKKQSTEKRIYNLKDFVVYPKHGVGKITAIEKGYNRRDRYTIL
jgi:CarD family transcriptional regulator